MSRFASLSRRLAIEDADTDIGEVEMVPAPEAEAPAAMAEVTEAGQEVEEITSAIGEASDDIDELETVGEIVSDSIEPEVAGGAEGPGMEPVAAALAAEAVKRLRKKWGLSSPSSIGAPALESFGRASSRKQATRLALLGITDTIKKVWEKIKAFFKGLWEKIRNAVVSIFQSNLKTQKRAQTLLKEITTNSNNFNKAEKEQVKSGSICTTFTDNGKTNFDVAKNIIERHMVFTGDTEKLNAEFKKFSSTVKASVEQAGKIYSTGTISNGTNLAGVQKDTFDAAENLYKAVQSTLTHTKENNSSVTTEVEKMFASEFNDKKVFVVGPFVRGKHMFFAYASKDVKTKYSDDAAEVDDKQFQFKMGMVDSSQSPSSECPTLKRNEMEEICKLVIGGCEAVAKSERAQKLGDDSSKQVMDLVDRAITVAQIFNDKGDEAGTRGRSELRSFLSVAKELTNSVINGLSNTNGSLRVGTMSALNNGLDYVAQSMKNYKK